MSYVSGAAVAPGTATNLSTVTLPAGLVAGQRVYVAISNGGANPNAITDPATATWIKADEYAPTGSFKSALYYIDVTAGNAAALSSSTHTWTWAVSARTTTAYLIYAGVDQTRAPLFARASATADSAAATNVPSLSVPAYDWEGFLALGRQSPGTDPAKSWAISGYTSDVERFDVYATNTGTGQKLSIAGYDTAGAASDSTGGGGGGSTVTLTGAPPLNAYNGLALTAPSTLRIGATLDQSAIGYWQPKLVKNGWMRIFPNSDKLPPAWDDSRFIYCRDNGVHPFISTKIDGDATKLSSMSTWLQAMPSWLLNDANFTLWYTEHHEPEKENASNPTGWKAQFVQAWNMVQALPGPIRAKIKMGPTMTKQWTEATGKGNFNYATFDPGVGDWWGVDTYANSDSGGAAITSYPAAVAFLSYIKAYVPIAGAGIPKIFPELGVIGAPFDTDGTARAAWIQAIYDEAKTWPTFGGFCWWNDDGTSGASITGVGTVRFFQLDRRHTGTDGSYATIPDKTTTVTVGGGGGSARAVTPNLAQANAHVWSFTVPMPTPAPPAIANVWTNMGLPIK
jgi:hypothetical protein